MILRTGVNVMWDFFLCSGDNLSKVPSPPYCNRNPLVAIVGPTGAGKSEFALGIAEQLDGEIVNCDSMQIYKGFDIGTAKLAGAEQRGIPHHLLSFVDPREPFSAGDYARVARPVIDQISARGRVPILVGGTGFYLRALLNGLPDLPPANACLRERLEKKSSLRLHRLLNRLDSAAAQRLHQNDRIRVIRALEIRLLTGSSAPPLIPSAAMANFAIRKIGLFPPRAELYRRLDLRTVRMFESGLIQEVEGLLQSGIPAEAKPFEAVGYRQALAVVLGHRSVAEAIAGTQRATRNYAKRQMTWFRNEPGIESDAYPDFEQRNETTRSRHLTL